MNIRSFSSPFVVLLAVVLLVAVPYGHMAEQNQTDAKIKLMSEALAARDAGDLAGAQKSLDQLATLTPNDPAVKRLRAEVEAQVAALNQQRAAEKAAADRVAAEA